MKKQTAVEFVIDEIRAQIKEHGRVDAITISALRQMGKGIEKQQIIEACNYGDFEELGEQYYNETYNS
jgi:hypothetical protein